MDTPASVRTGIAVAASLVLQACAMLPPDRAVAPSAAAGPAQATVTGDEPAGGGVDQTIARLRQDLLKVERLEADAARLYSDANKMPVKRACTLEDFPDPECGPSPEAAQKMHEALQLAAEASRLRLAAWQATARLAEALGHTHFPDLASELPRVEAADRQRHIAEVAELLARAGSKYPGGKPGSYMGDAYLPAEGAKPAASSGQVLRPRKRARPGGGARQALEPGGAAAESDQADSVFYSRAASAPAFAAPPVGQDPLAQANKASFQAIDGIVKGSAAISAPSSAKSGESFFVFLRVKPDELATLLASMDRDFADNETVIGKADVELTSKMTASVSGAGFKAVPKGELTQVVSATEPTTWVWEVEAVESGLHTLTFTLSGAVLVNGKPEPRNLYHYMQKVDVAVGVWGFIQEEWKWLIGTLALPALGFLWKEWVAKRKRKTTAPPGLAERLRRRRRMAVRS